MYELHLLEFPIQNCWSVCRGLHIWKVHALENIIGINIIERPTCYGYICVHSYYYANCEKCTMTSQCDHFVFMSQHHKYIQSAICIILSVALTCYLLSSFKVHTFIHRFFPCPVKCQGLNWRHSHARHVFCHRAIRYEQPGLKNCYWSLNLYYPGNVSEMSCT